MPPSSGYRDDSSSVAKTSGTNRSTAAMIQMTSALGPAAGEHEACFEGHRVGIWEEHVAGQNNPAHAAVVDDDLGLAAMDRPGARPRQRVVDGRQRLEL